MQRSRKLFLGKAAGFVPGTHMVVVYSNVTFPRHQGWTIVWKEGDPISVILLVN